MSAEVVEFTGITRLNVPPEKILQKALDAGLTEAVVIGLGPDGHIWFASSLADGANVLWHLEIAKKRLLEIMDTNPDNEQLNPPGSSG